MKKESFSSLKVRNTILLFITAIIWGAAFVAQSVGMDYIGPQTFIFARSVIGSLVLLPLIAFLDRKRKREKGKIHPMEDDPAEESVNYSWKDPNVLKGGALCGIFLYLANCCQQTGIQYTTAGKAGFITAFYIVLVPIVGLFMHKKCPKLVWVAVFIALGGLYLLCINESLSVGKGDVMVLGSAFFFACQIHSIDKYASKVDCIRMSVIQFAVNAILGCVAMLLFETVSWSIIVDAAIPILYCGILSSGVAYTLQIIGQKGMDPTVASLIMSMESVFSVVFGFLILGQSMSLRELGGCLLMCVAIVLAQLPEKKEKVTNIYEKNI